MASVGLQTIFLGSMLIFNDHALSSSSSSRSAAAVPSRCMSEDEVKNHGDKFVTKYRNKTASDFRPEDTNKTCEQAALEMRGEANKRSLSPWKYRLNREDDRFPRDIFFAECLCSGCITEQHEDSSYNSVLVHAPFMVLRKIPCTHDRNKYKLKKEIIEVPVACTCLMPKYSK